MWNNGIHGSPGLEKLGTMTIRLARLVMLKKLQAAQAQLHALGIENDIGDSFEATSLREVVTERTAPRHRKVKFIVKPGSDF